MFSILKKYVVLSVFAFAVSTPATAQGLSDFRLRSLQANAFEIQSSQIAPSKSGDPLSVAPCPSFASDRR